MARAQLVTVSLLIGAAAGAAAALFAPSPRENVLRDRISDLEADLVDAEREAGDWERVALAERDRKEAAEEESTRLRQAIATAPAPSPEIVDPDGMGGHGGRPDEGRIEPKDWDDPRLRMEIQRLAMRGRRMSSSPLLDACVEAARAQGDSALGLLIDIMRESAMPQNIRRAATLILERLGDPRAVNTLLDVWDESTDESEKRIVLRALANLPGAQQDPLFVTVWSDTTQGEALRMIAMHAMATRGQPTAVRAVRGELDGAQPAVRARAIESLHSRVRSGDYAETKFIPDFGRALKTADGEGQLRYAMLALEGYWRPECVAPLREFAALEGVLPELKERATRWANAIEAGEPRPERAGLPKAQTVDEDPANGGRGE